MTGPLIFKSDAHSEVQSVQVLLSRWQISAQQQQTISALAKAWVVQIRQAHQGDHPLDALFRQYQLNSDEGLALMCLAEALLRVPDRPTQMELIADKFVQAVSGETLPSGDGWLMQLANLGVRIGGEVSKAAHKDSVWQRMLHKLGAPLMREATTKAMALLGEQFILGHDLNHALPRMQANQRYSFDCLGEAAMTRDDAQCYFEAYAQAIEALANQSGSLIDRAGISIKLSALYPRYEGRCHAQAIAVLTERLLALAAKAAQAGILLTVDAEEANRLAPSLAIFSAVWDHPSLQGWDGLGLAVQAYQRRAIEVIDWVCDQSQKRQAKVHVRLVKGAYWDSEIKHAQLLGLAHYPVFTKKCHTDLSYLVCLKQLMCAPESVYPMVATHHPYTAAAAKVLSHGRAFEYQALHGMSQGLTHLLTDLGHVSRIYAPVGAHEDLLPYLVRRLLENGANSSFVHQVLNPECSVETLIENPVTLIGQPSAHAAIPLPHDLYPDRVNASGLDINETQTVAGLADRMAKACAQGLAGGPILSGVRHQTHTSHAVQNPANLKEVIGQMSLCDATALSQAIDAADGAHPAWQRTDVQMRAACLEKAAEYLEHRADFFRALLIKEAGKTWDDAIAEVREAIDFLHYYAQQAKRTLVPMDCPGPTGEHNRWQPLGRGVMVCISPWNFPLAIFIGQVSAALVAGNAVIAKPATQTSLIATEALSLLHEAGIPVQVCHLTPANRNVFGPLLSDERVSGVLLTGSTQTAKLIQRQLAERPGPIVPFVAETGGQNAMLVDSTALPEQVVEDVITSAFRSAGQRCSALRVLCLQADISERILTMLVGAMQLLVIGDPQEASVDIGPVIDQRAKQTLIDHQAFLDQHARRIHQCEMPEGLKDQGHFFAPCVYQIDDLSLLTEEVFGPILHVITYEADAWPEMVEAVHRTGYGLTFGIHSRIQSHIDAVSAKVRAGNVYVNRNMVGATVGVQPFGGEGLSGTGPKAGGPWYLQRLCKEQVISTDTTAAGGNASLWTLTDDQEDLS